MCDLEPFSEIQSHIIIIMAIYSIIIMLLAIYACYCLCCLCGQCHDELVIVHLIDIIFQLVLVIN